MARQRGGPFVANASVIGQNHGVRSLPVDSPTVAPPLTGPLRAPAFLPVTKRALDIAVAVPLLLLSLPVMAVAALATKLTDGGPVLFWQPRVGHGGRLFRFPKIRSMRLGAEALHPVPRAGTNRDGSVRFKLEIDPRVTRVGRILRKLSIDELPQLWCVLTGEMSIVGPRPPLPVEVRCYDDWARRRLDVKPGLTCIWQVSGRSDIPFSRQVELDLCYIETQSLWQDIKLILLTIPAVLSCRGAY